MLSFALANVSYRKIVYLFYWRYPAPVMNDEKSKACFQSIVTFSRCMHEKNKVRYILYVQGNAYFLLLIPNLGCQIIPNVPLLEIIRDLPCLSMPNPDQTCRAPYQ